MALPEIGAFEEFLEQARVLTEQPDHGLCEPIHSSTTSVRGPGVMLWLEYPRAALQLDSVLKKVGEGLTDVGAPSSRPIALAVLALILETKGASSHVEHANHFLREVREADLLFNFVSSSPTPTARIQADYGPVKVERFDPRKLEYWAGRGGAKWPVAPKELRGRVAVVGRVEGVTLINTSELPGAERLIRMRGEDPSKHLGLVDAYYQSVADLLLDHLKTSTAHRLSLVEAAGIAGFDFSSVMNWSLGLHLFTWLGSGASGAGCWAMFRQPGVVVNTPPAEIWQNAREWLMGEFGLDNLSGHDRPIDVAAQTFAGLMQAARAHMAKDRVREAFLYFVIALDHLLGEDGRNVSTVADRTGVLTHQIRSNTFVDEVARVRRVYDVRSRLVHSGSPVTVEDMDEAEAVARGVLWAITRVVADGALETRDEWVERIDSLTHLFRGDPDVVTMDRLAGVGVRSNFKDLSG